MNIYKCIYIAAALGGASLFSSCDNIDEDDRIVKEERPVLPEDVVKKKLLIQEFSGIKCTNCPDAAAEVHRVIEANPGQVVSVTMHPFRKCGNLTGKVGTTDLRSREVDQFCEYYGINDQLPKVVFNGGIYNGDIPSWFSEASTYFGQQAKMSITLSSQYDSSKREVTASYTVKMVDDVATPLNIMLFVIENDIIGYQQFQNGGINDYEHQHIFRGVLKASDDADIMDGISLGNSFTDDQEISGTASIVLKDNWVTDNCQIVAYVYSGSYKGGNPVHVEQAEEISIITPVAK